MFDGPFFARTYFGDYMGELGAEAPAPGMGSTIALGDDGVIALGDDGVIALGD